MLARLGLWRNPIFSHGVHEGFTPGLANFEIFLRRLGHPFDSFGVVHHTAYLALPEVEISLGKALQIWGISHRHILSLAYFSQNACCTCIKFLLRNNKLW